jgi:hypothetical protein
VPVDIDQRGAAPEDDNDTQATSIEASHSGAGAGHARSVRRDRSAAILAALDQYSNLS